MLGVRDVREVRGVRAAAGVLALLMAGACVPGPGRIAMPGSPGRAVPVTLRVQVRENGRLVVRDVPLERYVVGAALCRPQLSSSS